MDCWEKRGKKGYLFVTGDEPPLGAVNAKIVKNLIGDKLDEDIPVKQIAAEAAKTFHCFFLIPNQERRTYQGCERRWREVLGDRVICLEAPKDTCIVAATLMGLTEGTFGSVEEAAKKLAAMGRPKDQVERVVRAVQAYAATLPTASGAAPVPSKVEGPDKPAAKKADERKPKGKKPGRF
jgi:hypothetical protein